MKRAPSDVSLASTSSSASLGSRSGHSSLSSTVLGRSSNRANVASSSFVSGIEFMETQ